MLDTFLLDATAILGLLHVTGTIALHRTFRFPAHCQPQAISQQELAPELADRLLSIRPQLEAVRFEFLGCYDFGELAPYTRRFVGYFCNRDTHDFANFTISRAPGATDSYFEFSTSFSTGLTLETNNNEVLPLTPDAHRTQVFRFSEVQQPRELYQVHRQLIEKHIPGAWAMPEEEGKEILRLIRTFDNYGPRHAQMGYMKLLRDGDHYGLTWRGAALMAWRGMWPTVMFRHFFARREMRDKLRSLEVRGVAALQKA